MDKNRYSLIVAGAGFSGVAAAVTAARQGLNVLLIEQGNCAGGAAANCLVNPFMPYWTKIDGKTQNLSAGFFTEIINELKAAKALKDNNMTFNEEYLKLLLNDVLIQNNVNILYNTTVIDSSVEEGKIKSITVFNKSGKQEFFADYFIDATGDADLAVMSGVPCNKGRESDGLCQPMTLCFRVGNISNNFTREEKQRINIVYEQYKAEGKITNPREDVLVFMTTSPHILHFNTTRIVKLDPTDGFDITKAEIEARKQVFEIFDMLKKEIRGFESSVLLSTASKIGVRESRQIHGEHLLTAEELKDCTVFEDSIAVGNYDIDIHNPEGSGTSHYFFPEGKYYTIPYRSLVAKGIDNLLAAGRCISATHEAQASVRIMPICCCLGEAAGAAAAVAVNNKTTFKDTPIKQIQKIITDNGGKIF